MKKTEGLDFLIQELPRQLEEDPATGWFRRVWYLGPTRCLDELCIHDGVLSARVTPHEVHSHDHEEVHLALSNNLQYVTGGESSAGELPFDLPAGSLSFTDSRVPHTFRNTGDAPVHYLHARWRKNAEPPGGKRDVRFNHLRGAEGGEHPGAVEVYAGPSRYLSRLHVRYHVLSTGGVIPLHRHDHELLLALVEGSLEILGKTVNAPAFAFMGSRVPHSMINRDAFPARFYGIELHHS